MLPLNNLFIFWLAALSLVVSSSSPSKGSAVIDLVPSNFDNITQSKKPAFVEFFAPWCSHCKTLAPVWEELAEDFAFAKDKISIAKVDADAQKSLAKRFNVQGFPTIKYFDGISESPIDYSGGRDLESFSEFITQKTGLRSKKSKAVSSHVVILNDSTFKTQVNGDRDVIVAFTASWCGHCKKLAPIWEKLAEDFAQEPDVLVAKVDAEGENSKITAKDQGVTSYPTLKFFAKGKTESEPYNGGRTEADLVTFLNEKAGTHRVPGGGLDATAGTIEVLDKIASKFTSGTDIAEAAAEATKALQDITEASQKRYADYYTRIFQKIGEVDTFAGNELARLSKIIQKGNLAPIKLDEFTWKTNILKKFIKEDSSKSEL